MLKEKNSTKIHKIQGDWLLEEEKFNLTVSQFLRNAQNQTVSKAREAIGSVAKYINKSPSVKTFVYSTAILSAIPVGIFSIFIGITMAFSICTAGIHKLSVRYPISL